MRITDIVSAFALFVVSAVAQLDTYATYSTFYDNPDQSTEVLACSAWASTAGYATLGDIPNFAFLGGVDFVTTSDFSGCGQCWTLEYKSGQTIPVVVVDTASFGFNLSYIALDDLTSGSAKFLISVPVIATQVDNSECGL